MKKMKINRSALLCFSLFSFVLEGCTNIFGIVSHKHVYSNIWNNNGSQHWHECLCGEKNSLENHTFTWTIEKEATCDEAGLRSYQCSVCGYVLSQQEIAKKQHTFGEWQLIKSPTFSEKGKIKCICTIDENHFEMRELPLLNNTDYQVVTKSVPTCVSKEIKTYTITIDNKSFSFDIEVGEPLEHDFGEWILTLSPSFSSSGELTRTCSVDSSHQEKITLPAFNDVDYSVSGDEIKTYETIVSGQSFSFNVAMPKINQGILTWPGSSAQYNIFDGSTLLTSTTETSLNLPQLLNNAEGKHNIIIEPNDSDVDYLPISYEIVSLKQSNFVNELLSASSNKFYFLSEDIDISTEYDADGCSNACNKYDEKILYSPFEQFNSILEGNGFKVTVNYNGGSKIDGGWEVFGGLFGYTENAIIRNLNFEFNTQLNGHVNNVLPGGSMIGVLGSNTIIENCYISSSFKVWNQADPKGLGAIAGKLFGGSTGCIIKNNIISSELVNNNFQQESPDRLIASVGENITFINNSYIINKNLPAQIVVNGPYDEAFMSWEVDSNNNSIFASVDDFIVNRGFNCSYHNWNRTWTPLQETNNVFEFDRWHNTSFNYKDVIGITLCGKQISRIPNSYFVKNGVCDYCIVTPKNCSYTIQFAAEELQDIINEAIGTTLEIVSDDLIDLDCSKHFLSVGNTSLLNEQNDIFYSYETQGESGIQIQTRYNTVFMIGATDRGTLNSVYQFLHYQLGFKQFAYDCFSLNHEQNLDLINFNYIYKPSLEWNLGVEKSTADQRIAARMYSYADYYPNSNGYGIGGTELDGTPLFSLWCHDSNQLVPEATSPSGYWNNGQYCLTNENAYEAFRDALINKVVSSNSPFAMIGPADNSNACTCSSCMSAYSKYGGFGGLYMRFVNHLAEDIEAYFGLHGINRKLVLSILAYQAYSNAPVKQQGNNYVPVDESVIAKNTGNVTVGVCYAPISSCYMHALGDNTCDTNKSITENLRKWSSITNNIFLYTYGTNFNYLTFPYNNWDYMSNSFKFYEECNVRFLFDQSNSWNQVGPMSELRTYVRSSLGWNASTNINDLISEFSNIYYGPGADKFIDYFNAVKNHFSFISTKAGSSCEDCFYELGKKEYWPRTTIHQFEQLLSDAMSDINSSDLSNEIKTIYLDRINREYIIWKINELFLYESELSGQELMELRFVVAEGREKYGIDKLKEHE